MMSAQAAEAGLITLILILIPISDRLCSRLYTLSTKPGMVYGMRYTYVRMQNILLARVGQVNSIRVGCVINFCALPVKVWYT